MSNNNQQTISDRIITIGGKQKFFDFRDGLVPANMNDYAMLHGSGGSKHAASSVIKLTITDYSGGTGQNSTTVQANIHPSLVEVLRDKAEANMGTTYVPINAGIWGFVFKSIKKVESIGNVLRGMATSTKTLLDSMREAARVGAKGGQTTDVWMQTGIAIANGSQAMANAASSNKPADGQPQPMSVMEMPIVYDYHYEQTRVNTYKRHPSNQSLVSVSSLRIQRTGYRQNGDVSKLPWTVTISNFYAVEKKYPNGTSAYEPKTITDKKEAFFSLSDDDMFKAASRVCHYIQVFEIGACLPVVMNGRSEMEKNRMGARNNGSWQNQNQGQGQNGNQYPGYNNGPNFPPQNGGFQNAGNNQQFQSGGPITNIWDPAYQDDAVGYR